MPVTFEVHRDENFFIAHYAGAVGDADLLPAIKNFYESDEWVPGMGELIDFSKAERAAFTSEGLRDLAVFCEKHYRDHNVQHVRVALYAPKPLLYGLSRMYQVFSEDSAEDVSLFEDFEEAKRFVTGE